MGGSAPSLCQRAGGHQSRPWDLFRWIQAYAPKLEKRIRLHLHRSNGSWRGDETYVKVKGRWTYLYRAVDSRGQTIDFLLSAKRDAAAAKRFFRKALGQPHTGNPRTLTVDKNAAYPAAVTAMKRKGELWRFSRLRQVVEIEIERTADPSRPAGRRGLIGTLAAVVSVVPAHTVQDELSAFDLVL